MHGGLCFFFPALFSLLFQVFTKSSDRLADRTVTFALRCTSANVCTSICSFKRKEGWVVVLCRLCPLPGSLVYFQGGGNKAKGKQWRDASFRIEREVCSCARFVRVSLCLSACWCSLLFSACQLRVAQVKQMHSCVKKQ